ncbi:hypothetical protein [Paraburkholderia sp.]|uniref:hypothetical protein n=1 Tax=Paraburkholderia sp. TaxID=1926495 RepID=UPI00238EEB7A|nr:hypothetical protein [Paraburkholderia sp.]MDE1179547.1 hypothetical protein [Paraburkholderia sp.]
MSGSDQARPLEQTVFDEWPAPTRALFDGGALATKTGFTASLLTVDASAHVRTSLLGVGELYAPDSRSLCIALWPQSRAARVLAQDGRAALTFVCDDAFYQVQLRFDALTDSSAPVTSEGAESAAGGLACFIGWIDTGETQRVRYARLTGGVTFELADQGEAVLDRWERQIEYLKRIAASASRR